jgi:hypothetical protein
MAEPGGTKGFLGYPPTEDAYLPAPNNPALEDFIPVCPIPAAPAAVVKCVSVFGIAPTALVASVAAARSQHLTCMHLYICQFRHPPPKSHAEIDL